MALGLNCDIQVRSFKDRYLEDRDKPTAEPLLKSVDRSEPHGGALSSKSELITAKRGVGNPQRPNHLE